MILVPAMLIALLAQLNVSSTFNRYSRMASRRGFTGAQAAEAVLRAHGIQNVRIERVSGRLTDLSTLCSDLQQDNVEIYADDLCYNYLKTSYPSHLLKHASTDTFGTEFLDYKMAVTATMTIQAAVAHISIYGSGHSECIVTENDRAADYFMKMVDAACVYVNVPTSFTDGGEFGLGAEIGISTQKLHARGPMGLEELNTYKWIIQGDGQIRQ